MGLISEGSLSTAFRENYTLIQRAGDMKKKGGGLRGGKMLPPGSMKGDKKEN